MKKIAVTLVIFSALSSPALAGRVELHITKNESGITAANSTQFANGTSNQVLAMSPGVANFLEIHPNGSQICMTTSMLQNGQWTIFGIDPSTCHAPR